MTAPSAGPIRRVSWMKQQEIEERCRHAANSCYNRALVCARERELSRAVPLLRKALLLDKTHKDARNLLGLVYYEMGEVGDALVQWVISANMDQEDNRALFYLEDVRRKSGRLRGFDHMIRRYNGALELARNGIRDTAVHQLSGVVAEHPNYVRAGLLLGLLYMEQGEWEKAEHYLKQVLGTDTGNAQAVRYLQTVRENTERKAQRDRDAEMVNSFSHRKMSDDDVIMPPTYRESTGWQTILNIGMGLLIGAAAVLFLYMPTQTAEISQRHNQDLAAVSEKLYQANNRAASAEVRNEELRTLNTDLTNQLNTIQESDTYRLLQYQKLIGILDDYRNEDFSHAADLFATIDVNELKDIEDDTGISVTAIYESVAGKLRAEGYQSLYAQGENAYNNGSFETAISYYDKSLAINPDYEAALFKKAMSYKQLGDIQNANSMFGEVIMRFPDTDLAARAQRERGY